MNLFFLHGAISCLFWAQIALAVAHAISGPKTGSTFNPTLPMAQVMSLPRIQIIRAKRHTKKQVHWYFYANEKRVVSGPKHPQRGVKTNSGA